MRSLLVLCALLLLVAPAQAKNNKHKHSQPAVDERADTPFGFLPPPPPLPGMSKERKAPSPPPLPGMSRDKQQDIIERYYRHNEQERDQYRHYEDDDRGSYSHKKAKKKKNLPPGLRKKAASGKGLPPGWQKKIARGEVLDYELRGHCRDLPRELSRELPRPEHGTKFLRLEDKIIRVVESTFEIIDVFNVGR